MNWKFTPEENDKSSKRVNSFTLKPFDLPKIFIQLEERVAEAIVNTGE